jgi:hypothetical protein
MFIYNIPRATPIPSAPFRFAGHFEYYYFDLSFEWFFGGSAEGHGDVGENLS